MSDTTVQKDIEKIESAGETVAEDSHFVAERYEVGDLLGEGGMGIVRRAQDKSLDRTVAVKYLRAEISDKKAACDRFFEEAKIMGNLDHPGAVPVYELGTSSNGSHFYSMKKVSGQTLRELLREKRKQRSREPHAMLHLIDIFQRVCETIAYAHEKKIIHRDLKPENIMIDDFGAVFVMDWGIAKRLSSEGASMDAHQTREGAILGSPGYMAPEQAEGKTYRTSYTTDVFSLGVILYEILSGQRPFHGDTATQLIDDVIYHLPENPRRINRSIPRELAAICIKALEKDPRKRYQTAKELAEDIQFFREHRPVSAAPPRVIDRMGKWCQRHPAKASTIATLLFIAILIVTAVGFRHHREQKFLSMVFNLLDAERNEVQQLSIAITQTRIKLDKLEPGTIEQTRTQKHLHDLESLREVKERNVTVYLSAIIGSTFDYPDPRAVKEAREDRKLMIDRYFQEGKYAQAKYFIAQILEGARRENVLQYSESDVRKLESQLERAGKLSSEGYDEES